MLKVQQNNNYTVSPRADADTARNGQALTVVAGGLLSIAGFNHRTRTRLTSVSFYDITSDIWGSVWYELNIARVAASACVLQAKVYVFCG